MKNKNNYKDLISERIKFKDFYINIVLIKRNTNFVRLSNELEY